MLSFERMGLVALGILWVNTLLIAADAWRQALALLRRRASLLPSSGASGEGLFRARVDGGVVAVHRIEQVGHAARGREAVLFHTRRTAGEVTGAVLTIADVAVTLAPQAEAEVWVTRAEIAEASRCPSSAAFASAFAAARKARGFARTVTVEVSAPRQIYVAGRIETRGGTRALVPGAAGLLVSTLEPRAHLLGKAALALASGVVAVALAAGCTALALTPPHFGTVSTVGGALGLLFFLLVQPAGAALRDAVLVPSRAVVRGRWLPPRGEAPRAGGLRDAPPSAPEVALHATSP